MSGRRKFDQITKAWLGFFGSVLALFAAVAIGEVLASAVFQVEAGEQISLGAKLVVVPITFAFVAGPAIWGVRVALQARRQQLAGATLPLVACSLEIAYMLFVSVAGLIGWS